MSTERPAFEEPMTVQVVDGEIVVLGPDAVGVSITPDAAEESARRLIAAAQALRRGATLPSGSD
jgi:hypothetical protein